MNPLPFHILLALAASDASASEVLRQVNQDAAPALLVRERSFYMALKRLVEQGWVGLAVDNFAGRPRYRLTPFGRRRLQAEKIRLGRAVTLLHERL